MEGFIRDCKKDLIENNVGDNYCVIVYTSTGPFHSRIFRVKFIYKTLDEFEKKFKPEELEPMFGIDLRLWIYD